MRSTSHHWRRSGLTPKVIPVEPEQARKIERVLFVTKSEERIVEIGIDKISQEKTDRRKIDRRK